MSRTTRRHESKGRASRRGPKNQRADDLPKNVRKHASQRRRAERQALLRDWK